MLLDSITFFTFTWRMDQTPAPTQDVPSRTSLRITGAAVALALGGDGLVGTTPNSHDIAVIPLGGDGTAMETRPTSDEIGAFWSSTDDSTTVAGPGYGGTTVAVTTKAGGTQLVPVTGDPRSVALSADHRTIVEAGWFDGTRFIDVASGQTQLVMRGSQAFVALSERGDLAWANDEQFGSARLCTSTLARLGAG